jgi:hypothetical protein
MRAPLVAAAVLLSAACRSGGNAPPPSVPFDPPAVELRSVQPSGVGITGGSLNIGVSLYNPNGYQLAAPRFRYRVMIGSTRVGTGTHDADVTVAAGDSAAVRLPLSFSYASLGRAGRSLMSRGAVTYRVVGEVTVGTPHGRFSAPFDRTGQFSPLSAVSAAPPR